MSDTTAPTLPAAIATTDSSGNAVEPTLAEIVTALNDLIAFTGTLPTQEAELTSDQTAALARVAAFFG